MKSGRFHLLSLALLASLALYGCGDSNEVQESVLRCGAGTLETNGACIPSGALSCGAGTVEADGACIPSEGLRCGSGTVEADGACIPSEALSCGEGTREVSGRCVSDDEGLVCGGGTREVEGACVPSQGLSCGTGTSEVSGACVADPLPTLTPPEVTIISSPGTFMVGESRSVTFAADVDHLWQLELGGYYEGDGEFIAEGTGTVDSLVSTSVNGDDLGIGRHRLRLYVSIEEQGLRATAVVELIAFVRGDLTVLVWGGGTNTTAMIRDVLVLDDRVASAEIRLVDVINPSPPSLDYLNGFDVVVMAWSGLTQSLTGNRLAQYVEAGGAVVTWPGIWQGSFREIDGHPSWLTGNWIASDYGPLLIPAGEPYYTTAPANIGTITAGHPILEGVTSLTIASRPLQTLEPGAELVASWSDNVPLVATKGPVVALGWEISTLDTSLDGNWQRLLTNSVSYAASNVAP